MPGVNIEVQLNRLYFLVVLSNCVAGGLKSLSNRITGLARFGWESMLMICVQDGGTMQVLIRQSFDNPV